MSKKLTKKIKAKRVANAVISASGDRERACKKLGMSRRTLDRHLLQPETQSYMYKLIDSMEGGADSELVEATLQIAGNAKRPVVVDKELQFVADPQARLRALEILFKLKSYLQTGGAGVTQNIEKAVIFQEPINEDLPVGERIKKLNSRLAYQAK